MLELETIASFGVTGIAGLPLIVPIALMMTAVVGMLALAGGAVWAGSRKGRARIQEIAKPVIEKVNDDPEASACVSWKREMMHGPASFFFPSRYLIS